MNDYVGAASMSTMTFDTYQFVKTLEKAGFDEKQASAISHAFKDAQHQAELANKADLKELEIRLVKWIAALAFAEIALLLGILLKIS